MNITNFQFVKFIWISRINPLQEQFVTLIVPPIILQFHFIKLKDKEFLFFWFYNHESMSSFSNEISLLHKQVILFQ